MTPSCKWPSEPKGKRNPNLSLPCEQAPRRTWFDGTGETWEPLLLPSPCPLNSLSPVPVLSPFIGVFSAFLSSACPMLENLFKISRLGMIMECLFHSLNLLFVWFLFSLVSNSKEQTKTRLKQTISLPVS